MRYEFLQDFWMDPDDFEYVCSQKFEKHGVPSPETSIAPENRPSQKATSH